MWTQWNWGLNHDSSSSYNVSYTTWTQEGSFINLRQSHWNLSWLQTHLGYNWRNRSYSLRFALLVLQGKLIKLLTWPTSYYNLPLELRRFPLYCLLLFPSQSPSAPSLPYHGLLNVSPHLFFYLLQNGEPDLESTFPDAQANFKILGQT